MKHILAVMIALHLTSCGSDSFTESHSSLANEAPSPRSEVTTVAENRILAQSSFESKNSLSSTAAQTIIEQAEGKIAVDSMADIKIGPSEQKSFMQLTKLEVESAFCSAKAKNGKQLSRENCLALAGSFMLVIEAASSKNPIKVSATWNSFIQSAQKMNATARFNAAGNGGLIADILGLGVDIINLAVDLIAAVLALDLAGVVNVALDTIDTIIDFLV